MSQQQPGVVIVPATVYPQQMGAPSQATQYQPGHVDGEYATKMISLEPPDVRNGFIRKVYSVLSMQLALTTVIAAYISTQSLEWVARHIYVFYAAQVVSLIVLFGVVCCCQEVARRFPSNYIFLFVITIAMGITTGFVASMYTVESVLLALASTSVVFFALTAFACLTKSDFTGMGPYLYAALLSLIGFSFVLMIFSMITGNPINPTLNKLYAMAGVLIFSMYIVYDTQKIVGGAHKKFQFSVDDYVFAALNLYLDILNLFLMLLQLMGGRRS